MTELEKIQYTKAFIDKLANGVNPLTDEAIPEDDLLNNVRISRCMFYVSNILNELCQDISSGKNKKQSKNSAKNPFCIESEQLKSFAFSDSDLYVGDIVFKLNSMIDENQMKKINYRAITDWLVQQQYLYLYTMVDGKKNKRPTQAGTDLGITEELRTGQKGNYYVLKYNVNAQKYIVEHCNEIGAANKSVEKQPKSGKPWTAEQEQQLITMFNDGLLVEEIAKACERTPGAIRARLVHLALISDRNEAK